MLMLLYDATRDIVASISRKALAPFSLFSSILLVLLCLGFSVAWKTRWVSNKEHKSQARQKVKVEEENNSRFLPPKPKCYLLGSSAVGKTVFLSRLLDPTGQFTTIQLKTMPTLSAVSIRAQVPTATLCKIFKAIEPTTLSPHSFSLTTVDKTVAVASGEDACYIEVPGGMLSPTRRINFLSEMRTIAADVNSRFLVFCASGTISTIQDAALLCVFLSSHGVIPERIDLVVSAPHPEKSWAVVQDIMQGFIAELLTKLDKHTDFRQSYGPDLPNPTNRLTGRVLGLTRL